MKKGIKISIMIVIICVVLVLMINGALRFGFILGRGFALMGQGHTQVEEETEKVETFFKQKGYEIEIIGAHTNGREHEGPFLYGWYWKSFEIGPEVIMLYYYDDMDEIDGYLNELDDETRDKCKISEHFIFYYGGSDQNIMEAIIEFCE